MSAMTARWRVLPLSIMAGLCMAFGSAAMAEEPYRGESPLPAGWPAPGMPGVVELAYLADYRVAEASRFMTLFGHISRNNIPMTAPVIMPVDGKTARQQGTMQFIYPDATTAATSVSQSVSERDHAGQWVLRIAHRGRLPMEQRTQMLATLYQEAQRRGLAIAGQPAMFGYNSPMMRSSRRTTEMVLPVVLIPASPATDYKPEVP